MAAFVIRRRYRPNKPNKTLNFLQLLVALEQHGVCDVYISMGNIIMVTIDGPLNLPDWLAAECNLHRDDLWRMLRRVNTCILVVGDTK